MLLLMTNRKLHMLFGLVLKSVTLDPWTGITHFIALYTCFWS